MFNVLGRRVTSSTAPGPLLEFDDAVSPCADRSVVDMLLGLGVVGVQVGYVFLQVVDVTANGSRTIVL